MKKILAFMSMDMCISWIFEFLFSGRHFGFISECVIRGYVKVVYLLISLYFLIATISGNEKTLFRWMIEFYSIIKWSFAKLCLQLKDIDYIH